jgi:5-hydroxyisourate hydrolase
MTVSTHVLDASLGTPAPGITVTLARLAGGWLAVESGATGPDGRHRFDAHTPAGTYRLTFATGAYFTARAVKTFYPEVTVTFTIPDAPADGAAASHFHVPLLLSPFAYSTYRGS